MPDVLHETAISDAKFLIFCFVRKRKGMKPIANVMALDQNISVNAQIKGRIP
jgi:hypothetical protein